jgi:hypothetical protein
MTTINESQPGDVEEQDRMPVGADGAGRQKSGTCNSGIETNTGTRPRQRTTPCSTPSRTKKASRKKPGCKARTARSSGGHIPSGIFEAARMLRAEGYRVSRVLEPGFPFQLLAWNRNGTLLVRVVRPREPVANAAGARDAYDTLIRQMALVWQSPEDNLQFWIFSRENGLLRYRVYDWGIGNVGTMDKIMKTGAKSAPVTGTAAPACPVQPVRSAPCTISPSGPEAAPVASPVPGDIPS